LRKPRLWHRKLHLSTARRACFGHQKRRFSVPAALAVQIRRWPGRSGHPEIVLQKITLGEFENYQMMLWIDGKRAKFKLIIKESLKKSFARVTTDAAFFMKNFPDLLLLCLAIGRFRGHSEVKRVSRLPHHHQEFCGVFNPVPFVEKESLYELDD
jgi:hypothetical protein